LQRIARSVPWPIKVAGDSSAPDTGTSVPLPDLELLGLLSREELCDWMRRAAIFAAPAAYEPFGLSILEAASFRCALVLGDIPSLRELWEDCALFVDPGDTSGLARALNRLIEDAALCERLGERAHERAQSYGVERMARSYLDLYRSLHRPPVAARPPELSS